MTTSTTRQGALKCKKKIRLLPNAVYENILTFRNSRYIYLYITRTKSRFPSVDKHYFLPSIFQTP